MKIEPLDDKTVKIVLSRADMEDLDLTYEELDYKNPATKRVILRLIEEVRLRSGVDLSVGKLFIEAFPYADGGCILYANLLDAGAEPRPRKSKTSFDTPLIFTFDTLEALVPLASRLNGRYGHVILKNSLWLWQDSYLLMVYTYFKMDGQITRLMSEYGRFFGKGAVASALVREHGKELIGADAIQLLEQRLS